MKTKKTEHPFYCDKKKCRKTAWGTPEYLTEDDWKAVKEFVDIAETKDADKAFNFIWNLKNLKDTQSFFNRVLGWPEGYTYCQSKSFWEKTAFPGIVKHNLDDLKSTLKNMR
jgi:hypothetical protein